MTHQIKISERESEAFPLSSWGCSQLRTPPPPAPPAGGRTPSPLAPCDQPHRPPSCLSSRFLGTRGAWSGRGFEAAVRVVRPCLRRLWTPRSSSPGRRSRVEAERLHVGPTGLETLAREQRAPPGRARSQSHRYLRCRGRAALCPRVGRGTRRAAGGDASSRLHSTWGPQRQPSPLPEFRGPPQTSRSSPQRPLVLCQTRGAQQIT